jgi:outer membrane autotransporter protein
VTEALDAISGEQITSQQTTAIDFSMTQLLNVGARLEALRMGSRGFSTAGLNFGNPIGGVPVSALASRGKLLHGEGGASGDDDEGGLLDRRLGIFVNGAIRWGDKDRTERESGFDFESQGLTVGADYRFTDAFVAGLALGYATGDADFDNDGGSQDSDGYSGSVYGTWYNERGYFDAIGSYGQVSYDSIRNINIASLGISDRALGDTDADQWALGLGTGYDFGKGALRFGPTLSLNYVKIEVDGFTETAEGDSGLAMRFDDQSADSLTAKLGAQLAYHLSRKWGIFTPQARFEFVREFRNDSQQVTVRFANDLFVGAPGEPDTGFVVVTDEPDENYFNWAVGFSATFANGFSGFVDYESTESLDTIQMQEVSFGLRYETKFR